MIKTPADWLRDVSGWAKIAVIVGLLAASTWYIASTPYEADAPDNVRLTLKLTALGVLLVFVFLASGSAMDQFNWHGLMPVDVPEGYAWRRSIRSRLQGFSNLGFILIGYRIVFLPYAAWQHQDWGRVVVSGLMIAAFCYVILLVIIRAFSSKVVLTIDSDGFRGVGMPGGDVTWDRIERLSVGGQSEARELTMFEHGKDGDLGPAHTINLAAAGISVRSFLAKVSEFAPHIEVTSPASRMADFSAA